MLLEVLELYPVWWLASGKEQLQLLQILCHDLSNIKYKKNISILEYYVNTMLEFNMQEGNNINVVYNNI